MKKNSSPRDAFFNPRVLLGFVLGSVGVALALIGFGLYPGASLLAQKPGQPQPQKWQPKWEVIHSTYNDVSAPLREMAPGISHLLMNKRLRKTRRLALFAKVEADLTRLSKKHSGRVC